MDITTATAQYEAWLGSHLPAPVIPEDLARKHHDMAQGAFIFLRATFYRWAQLWPTVCPELASAPAVLAVGDLHVENFGTWRDAEGRLIWGVNDFDECCTLPYTNDLVRLATSVNLASLEKQLAIPLGKACATILDGYATGLKSGGAPFVLAEHHRALRDLAMSDLRDPEQFWQKMDTLPSMTGNVPASAVQALERALPERGLAYRLARRVAGEGSLGRARLVALSEWYGGHIAREAKALLPSAWVWAHPTAGPPEILYQTLIDRAIRCPDPTVTVQGQWIVRRLAPDCTKIEMGVLPKERDEVCLLQAMGGESANMHLGSAEAIKAVRQDLKRRPASWLETAAKAMTDAVRADWKAWKSGTGS